MKTKITILMILALCASMVKAQTAEEVVKNYLEITGGAEKWRNLSTMVQEIKMNQSGFEFPGVIKSAEPNLFYMQIDVQGQKIVQAYDGSVAWTVNPLSQIVEPTKLTGEDALLLTERDFQEDLLDYTKKGHTVELEGREEIDGTSCHKIKLTKANGDTEFHYFDVDSGARILLRGFSKAGPFKGQAIDTFFSDYQETEGLMLPMVQEQKTGEGQSIFTITIEKIEFNVKLPKEEFSFPKG